MNKTQTCLTIPLGYLFAPYGLWNILAFSYAHAGHTQALPPTLKKEAYTIEFQND